METLVDHSLVQFDLAEGRYVLLETVRAYAAALLARFDQADLGHGRLLDWTAAFAHDVRGGLERADADALHRVGHADAAVLTALNRALSTGRGVEVAAGIAVDLAFGWSLRGRCGKGVALVQRLTAELNPPPPALQWAHGFLAIYSGDMEAGFGLATAAVEHAGQDGRTAARARILLGMVQAFVDPVGAEPLLAEAVTLAGEAGDDWGQVEASRRPPGTEGIQPGRICLMRNVTTRSSGLGDIGDRNRAGDRVDQCLLHALLRVAFGRRLLPFRIEWSSIQRTANLQRRQHGRSAARQQHGVEVPNTRCAAASSSRPGPNSPTAAS